MAKFIRKQARRALKIGLDISSTDTGVAVIDKDDKLAFRSHFESGKGDYIRLIQTASTIVATLDSQFSMDDFDEIQVYPEQVFMGRNAYAMMTPLIMHGVMLAKLYELSRSTGAEFYWNEVSVSTWRNWLIKKAGIKAASKKSKDLKEATMNALLGLWGLEMDNQNTADACGIALWARENTK